jgi:hypothetical protein
MVLEVFKSPQKSVCQLCAECLVSQVSIVCIMEGRWHLYKMLMYQHYREDNLDWQLEFCEWATNKYDSDINFSSGILGSQLLC